MIKLLDNYRKNNVTLDELKRDTITIKGIDLSTMYKLLYFMKVKVDNEIALILDLKIINVIDLRRFEELKPLIGIKYIKAIDKYVEYLKCINQLASELKVLLDQIELFLFLFGQNLSNVNCEKCFNPYRN